MQLFARNTSGRRRLSGIFIVVLLRFVGRLLREAKIPSCKHIHITPLMAGTATHRYLQQKKPRKIKQVNTRQSQMTGAAIETFHSGFLHFLGIGGNSRIRTLANIRGREHCIHKRPGRLVICNLAHSGFLFAGGR